MATPTTLLVRKRLILTGRLDRIVWAIPSVLPSSPSPRFDLELITSVGTIKQLKFAMVNAAVVDLFLGAEDINFRGTIAEILRIGAVNQDCPSYTDLNVIFENTDSPEANRIYLELDNTNSINATGAITMEIILQEGD